MGASQQGALALLGDLGELQWPAMDTRGHSTHQTHPVVHELLRRPPCRCEQGTLAQAARALPLGDESFFVSLDGLFGLGGPSGRERMPGKPAAWVGCAAQEPPERA